MEKQKRNSHQAVGRTFNPYIAATPIRGLDLFFAGHDPGAYMSNMILEAALPPGRYFHDRSTVAIMIVSPIAAPAHTPSLVPPMLASSPIDTPAAIYTTLPTATPTTTPTRLQAPPSALLLNSSRCLIGMLAITVVLLMLSLLLMGLAGRL